VYVLLFLHNLFKDSIMKEVDVRIALSNLVGLIKNFEVVRVIKKSGL